VSKQKGQGEGELVDYLGRKNNPRSSKAQRLLNDCYQGGDCLYLTDECEGATRTKEGEGIVTEYESTKAERGTRKGNQGGNLESDADFARPCRGFP